MTSRPGTRIAAGRHEPPPAPRRARPDPTRPRTRPAAPLRWLGRAIVLLVAAGVAAAAVLLWLAWDLPRPEAALAATRRPGVTLLAADGTTLATAGDLYGETLRLRDLPAHLPAALLAAEDRRFHQHIGLDLAAILRAALANWRAGATVQGGSTLTQQLAKNLFLSPERTFRRKGQEALLALWLERRFTKVELLEIYLNRVYLGAGFWGVDAAARGYFGVSARRVLPWQSALLAGLPKAPSRLNPRVAPDLALARAAEILQTMTDTGALTRAEAAAETARMRLAPPPARPGGAFVDWVLADLPARFPGRADLTLRTTLDPRLQQLAEVRLDALLSGPGARAGATQGAVVVLDAATGAVRAMVGGREAGGGGFNRAVQARRQPGSAFKPIVFLAALERGLRPEDPVADTPITLGRWSPGNGAWRAQGEITVTDALVHSVNTAAVRVLARAGGPAPVAALARRLGLGGALPADASLALGTGEVSLLELAGAYAAIAAGGLRAAPYGVAGAATPPTRVLDAGHAQALQRMLEAAVTRGTGRAAALPGRGVAGKTGTTQDFRDAWFVGMLHAQGTGGAPGGGPVVIGVWLGRDDARPMDEVRGGTLPALLFRDIAGAL